MLAQAQLAARRLRPIGTDREREGRGNLHLLLEVRQGDEMDDWQLIRIIWAAEFTGRSLRVQLMTVRRGNEPEEIHFRIVPHDPDDADLLRWRYGSWGYPRVEAEWPLHDVDPWEAASYTGTRPTVAKRKSDEPCQACGTAKPGGGNYCGQCGWPLDPVEALAATLAARPGDSTAGSSEAGGEISALVGRYTAESLKLKAGRPELIRLIRTDFTETASARFTRGEPARDTGSLTLAVAQEIHQTFASKGHLEPRQVGPTEALLRYAPLRFGYWGAFKAVVKSVPVDTLPDAYADAVARISSKDTSRQAPLSAPIEDIGFLREFSRAPSRDTLKYLARRVRRDLANLAADQPDLYAQVAARVIVSWDQELSRGAYAPAYVMLGAQSPLDAHSEHVDLEPDMSSRRDAHPEIWNDRPEVVQQIFDGVKNSVEAQTWSYQVLDSIGQAPAVTGAHLRLAIQSSYSPLNLAGCAALCSRPKLWDSLTVREWLGFFFHGSNGQIASVLDAMSVGKLRPAVVDAARFFLLSGLPVTAPRRLPISQMFLAAVQRSYDSGELDARAAASATLMAQSAVKNKKLWGPAIQALDVGRLERIRQSLPDKTAKSAIVTIDEVVMDKRAQRADPSEALDWISSDEPLKAKYGWRLLDAGYGVAGLLQRLPGWITRRLPPVPVIERIISEVVPRATEEDVPALANAVRAALTRRMDTAALIAVLIGNPIGPAVLWRSLAERDDKAVEALLEAESAAIRLFGDAIKSDQLASATNAQLLFALHYIEENPSRIAEDFAFGCAAATSSSPALQVEGLRQLQRIAQMPQAWLVLAESAVPEARTAARKYLAALGAHEFRDAVVRCMDSGSPEAVDMGSQLLHEKMASTEDRAFWNALAESDDHRLEELVAGEPRIAALVDSQILAAFDQRVLLDSSRGSRRVKERVKTRLGSTPMEPVLAAGDRITALLELARGDIGKDAEWALQELAQLALAGVDIDGLTVSLVTTSDGS